jgi:hypothetical protein
MRVEVRNDENIGYAIDVVNAVVEVIDLTIDENDERTDLVSEAEAAIQITVYGYGMVFGPNTINRVDFD